jgi:hypothetical protein
MTHMEGAPFSMAFVLRTILPTTAAAGAAP